MRKPILAIIPAILFAGAVPASTVEQSQLASVRGITLRVQVIDHDDIHARSLDPKLQKVGDAAITRQKLSLTGGPKQILFVTLVVSRVPSELCGADLVLLKSEVLFTDDLSFARDPSIQSPKGVVTWHSTGAAVIRRSEVESRLRTQVEDAVEYFIGQIPGHAFVAHTAGSAVQ